MDFYTRFYPLHYFLILILEKEPVFPFLMFSARLNPGPPALEANTLPLGYRGAGSMAITLSVLSLYLVYVNKYKFGLLLSFCNPFFVV